jgi:hypothetical protein
MKKIGSSQFKELLLENSNAIMEGQKDLLTDFYLKWKGDEDQVNDITILGFRV